MPKNIEVASIIALATADVHTVCKKQQMLHYMRSQLLVAVRNRSLLTLPVISKLHCYRNVTPTTSLQLSKHHLQSNLTNSLRVNFKCLRKFDVYVEVTLRCPPYCCSNEQRCAAPAHCWQREEVQNI